MLYALLASIAGNAVVVGLFLREQRITVEKVSEERQTLLQRIQAPVSAIASHAEQTSDEIPPELHLPFDDDDAFAIYKADLRGSP